MRALLVLVAVLFLAGCGHENASGPASQDHPAASPQKYAVATAPSGDATLTASLAGVLHGQTNDDNTACFWLELTAKAGSPAGRLAVIWPHGSRAYADPLRVVDGDGTVIATAGQTVSLTGGFIGPETVPFIGCPDFTSAFGA